MTEAAVSTTDLRSALADQLTAARRRTLDLLAPLSDEALTHQHSELMSPLVWDLAHIGWFEELWLLRRVAGTRPLTGDYEGLYDAFDHPRAERGRLPLMSPDTARSYLADVRGRVLDVLEHLDLDTGDHLLADGFVYGMVIQHEHQHCETILACLALRDEPYPLPAAEPPAGRPIEPRERLVEGGTVVVGADRAREPWGYDNERPEHAVTVQPFWLDVVPVTNRDYAQFVEGGGYDDERVWAPEGWAYRREAGIAHPLYWRYDGPGSWARVRFGHAEELPPDELVQHVSWYEADAYARWAGKRLPTELEWEAAASAASDGKRRYPWGDSRPTGGQANLAPGPFRPAPAGAYPDGAAANGCEQLVGDVWEWTSSDFTAYPGFEAFPYAEYSEVFFGSEYKVLRGGSWATHPLAVRSTFRNWDLPIRRQIFAGFRCARDA